MFEPKGDATSGFTILFSLLGLWMADVNTFFGEYQATINMIGVFGGLILTGWFYYRSDRHRTRDRDLRYREFEAAERHRNGHDEPEDTQE